MKAIFHTLNKLGTGLACVAALLSAVGIAQAAEVKSTAGFTPGQTKVVFELSVDDYPDPDKDVNSTPKPFKRSDLNTIYANSRLNSQNNKPVFTAFDQDPNVPNQQRLTYLNVQQALNTMLYGDDPKRKQIHLASMQKSKNKAQNTAFLGTGTKVGIIDSGINTKQPNFNQSIKVRDLGGQKYADEVTHGTTVALTAAGTDGKYQGVAPGARVNAYAIDPENVILEDVFEQVYRDKVSVANASFVLGDDTSIYPAISRKFHDIFADTLNAPLYVFASGNMDEPDSSFSPLLRRLTEDTTIMKNTIVVSGAQLRNPNAPVSANNVVFSQDAISCRDVKYNCLTAFFAYDVPDPRATKKGKAEYITTYGTSFAAPQVSGGAALVKQMFPWFNANNIRQSLLTTATDIGAPGIDDKTGWGLLNVGAAVYGPAQFAFGDFVADLTHDRVSKPGEFFFFRHNIFGQYGLIVRDETESDDGKYRNLVLTGNNTYAGQTTVESGYLRLEGSLTSQTNINSAGVFTLAQSGQSGNIYNNGFFVSIGGTVNGNLVNTPNAFTTIQADQVLKVTKEAKLGGTLVISLPEGLKPKAGQAYLVLKAKKLTGEFARIILPDGYTKGEVLYNPGKGEVAVQFK